MLEISTSAGATTISVVGDLDVTVRDQFPEVTSRISTLGTHLLVLDLCRLDFMDSTGAAFVATVAESTRRAGGVAMLRGADEHAAFVLDICGVLEQFRVDDAHRCPNGSDSPDATDSTDATDGTDATG